MIGGGALKSKASNKKGPRALTCRGCNSQGKKERGDKRESPSKAAPIMAVKKRTEGQLRSIGDTN